MGIDRFLKDRTVAGSRIARFEQQLKKCETPQQERELEGQLLKPEKLPPYSGEHPLPQAANPLLPRTVKIVFRDDASMALFTSVFPVSTHIEPSISNPRKLLAFCKAVEDGLIIYDKCKGKFNVGNQEGPRKRTRTRCSG